MVLELAVLSASVDVVDIGADAWTIMPPEDVSPVWSAESGVTVRCYNAVNDRFARCTKVTRCLRHKAAGFDKLIVNSVVMLRCEMGG
jgi:hypothetical protein